MDPRKHLTALSYVEWGYCRQMDLLAYDIHSPTNSRKSGFSTFLSVRKRTISNFNLPIGLIPPDISFSTHSRRVWDKNKKKNKSNSSSLKFTDSSNFHKQLPHQGHNLRDVENTLRILFKDLSLDETHRLICNLNSSSKTSRFPSRLGVSLCTPRSVVSPNTNYRETQPCKICLVQVYWSCPSNLPFPLKRRHWHSNSKLG